MPESSEANTLRAPQRRGTTAQINTETTGLDDDARIVEIAIYSPAGHVALETLLNPGEPIPEDASEVHGITDQMVAQAPSFSEVLPKLTEALAGRRRLIYKASFDSARLQHELARHHQQAGHPAPDAAAQAWLGTWQAEDVMKPYAEWVGEWSDYWGGYAGQGLHGGHRALGDCKALLERLKEMAKGRGFALSEGGSKPNRRVVRP
ncbi:3'-5' exonuclease [Streptomyces sp. NPDC053367]|uniref:3'-5' exonuclease n=1 Tax=Streptomyces sp. NPDC053367 TaxID=3365700 RepID=UPI0037D5F74B